MDILKIISRTHRLFTNDISNNENSLQKIVSDSSFLVIGGAGSIGQAVTKEIFARNPKKLHVVDISENNLVELVRDLRSTYGYIDGEFKTFALDVSSVEYDAFIEDDGKYDYVLNLSALKHVRSEKDPYTLMRLIEVNILNTEKTILQSINNGVKKYFCVSTDKAANPVNMMGASKRIMEMYLMSLSQKIDISTARFANVAFSDGSLLYGFEKRIQKKQPIVAPNDIKRYFITPQESGQLCLMSCIFGNNRDIFFPKLDEELHLVSFADVAVNYLNQLGFDPYICVTEEEARKLIDVLPKQKKWPCFFSSSDTTGEKEFEEFYVQNETLVLDRYKSIGIITNSLDYDSEKIEFFSSYINNLKYLKKWNKADIINLFLKMIPEFKHKETGKYLDSKM
jgi:FlaA1/EpsC-like NDP-sugar epimerase